MLSIAHPGGLHCNPCGVTMSLFYMGGKADEIRKDDGSEEVEQIISTMIKYGNERTSD